MVPIDGKTLDIFRAVAETVSATRAAERLNTSQPNITRIIAAFEKNCGFPLFERGRFGMTLTRQGEVLLAVVERNFAGMRTVQRAIDELRMGIHGTLWSIGIPAVTEGVLAGLMGEFLAANPQIGIIIKTGSTDMTLNGILSGEVDMGAIIGQPPLGMDMEVIPLATRRLMAAVGPRHRLAGREWVHFTELDGEAFVFTERLHIIRTAVDRMMVELGVRPRMTHEASPQRAVAELVRHSGAVGFVETEIVESQPAGALVGLRLEPAVSWTINLIYRRDRERSVVFEAFLNWLKRRGAAA
jgi:DNA-binding transcriptional LysR family regulator